MAHWGGGGGGGARGKKKKKKELKPFFKILLGLWPPTGGKKTKYPSKTFIWTERHVNAPPPPKNSFKINTIFKDL
jgi:hypothetical protein